MTHTRAGIDHLWSLRHYDRVVTAGIPGCHAPGETTPNSTAMTAIIAITAAYPPEPWRLRGQLHASVFLIRLAAVPVDLPPGWRPVRLGRFGVVSTAWVTYAVGGVLSYDELMSTLLVRRGVRVLPTITHIWVDSPASRDGGRDLWGIPKQLATFVPGIVSLHASDDHGPIAVGTVLPRRSAPGRVPCGFHVVQRFGGGREDHAGAGAGAVRPFPCHLRRRSARTPRVPGRASPAAVVRRARLPDDVRTGLNCGTMLGDRTRMGVQ
ncbi:MAG: acetoacetate decarboxylase family protein [Jatrophihabitantaceae bacterium]